MIPNDEQCRICSQSERDKVLDEALSTLGEIKFQEEDIWLFEAVSRKIASLRSSPRSHEP